MSRTKINHLLLQLRKLVQFVSETDLKYKQRGDGTQNKLLTILEISYAHTIRS
jgi:hypothetical protein